MSRYKKCDDLYRAYLKKKRGLKCEICGKDQERLSHALSVFHILPKGSHPRLRYCEENMLLACWTAYESSACHNIWHGAGHGRSHDQRRETITNRIVELRGSNYRDNLLIIEKTMSRHNGLYLSALEKYLKKELKK